MLQISVPQRDIMYHQCINFFRTSIGFCIVCQHQVSDLLSELSYTGTHAFFFFAVWPVRELVLWCDIFFYFRIPFPSSCWQHQASSGWLQNVCFWIRKNGFHFSQKNGLPYINIHMIQENESNNKKKFIRWTWFHYLYTEYAFVLSTSETNSQIQLVRS